MTDIVRALLRPGYEPGDGSADGAQQVDEEWWHPAFGCDSLQMVVDNARSMLELPPGYIDPEHQDQDLEMLQAFYRACNAEGGTADEIHPRGIKAALATQQAAQSASNSAAINVIFDAPPGPEGGRFIEVETDDGRSIRAGEWLQRQDGNWALRLIQAGAMRIAYQLHEQELKRLTPAAPPALDEIDDLVDSLELRRAAFLAGLPKTELPAVQYGPIKPSHVSFRCQLIPLSTQSENPQP